ncbi:MAG: PD-(D/E)XK nuclease family transposase, partial [Bacteroidales bacterium]|nr:PD-(D/E)XK nuclease family transposase [Bacteroidales bacterium]
RLNEVCVVGILDFVFPNKEYADDSYVHKVMLKDTDDNHEVYDKLTFYYVEMPKFKKTEDELVSMQDKWLYVLKNVCYLLKQPKELQDQVFTKFFEEARIGKFTKEEQFAYMVSQKHYWDNHNTLAYSYEKGEANAKSEIARKLLSMGLSKEQVFEATGYSL